MRTRTAVVTALGIAACVAATATGDAQSPAPRPAAAAALPTDPAAVLQRYCVSCHNERLKTGGVSIDPSQLTAIGEHAEDWEKVVRKLRSMSMPPPGAPRPDESTYHAVATSLETALDRAAVAAPRLGRAPLARRLTRTEYANAVRDLFALDALPQELGIELLLPADNMSSGFDNIADLLFVSPSNMERYLDAARKVSRLAVGDPSMPLMVNIHPLDAEHPQDERVDDLAMGTRGGIAIRSTFPVDATYTLDIDLAGAAREPHQLEVTVDGQRVALEALGGRAGGGRGGAAGAGRAGGGGGGIEVPLRISAGTHLIGVAFIQRTEARDEATLRPRTRSRGTQPAIGTVTIRGPHDVTGPGNSPSRARIFTCRPRTAADEAACGRTILSTLARRAYRRPVSGVDVDELMPFFTAGRTGGTFDAGIQRAIERLLVSPQFLFRIERPTAATVASTNGRLTRVSDIDLASRLSFFIWSSIPDDQLLDVAVAGRLSDPQVLQAQTRRLLADPRADAMVTNFAAQWLYLRDITAKFPDEVLFQDFDETLRQAMRRETELFVSSVFQANRPVVELLSANYTFLNERLARHYGLSTVRGSWFRRVELPANSVRGGLLGQGSVLTITSYATRTSPVLRGKWVLENLLSSPPPPPPPDVPSLDTAGTNPERPPTMREAMVRHRANPACASCHARMDPIGFAMENFDAVGRWRDTDGGAPIDATGAFPEGAAFTGVAGLKAELLRHPEPFVGTVAERLLMYGIGRNLQYYDQPAVRAILRQAPPAQHTLQSLVLGVVGSRPFQMREAGSE